MESAQNNGFTSTALGPGVQKRKAVGISCKASVVIDGSVPWLDITMGGDRRIGWTMDPDTQSRDL